MSAEITRMKHNSFVRFFSEYQVCDHCGQETRGRCYAETEQVVCSKCKGVLLDMDAMDEEHDVTFVMFTPDTDPAKEALERQVRELTHELNCAMAALQNLEERLNDERG
jgi:Zn-finger nucleic acid-binding protein